MALQMAKRPNSGLLFLLSHLFTYEVGHRSVLKRLVHTGAHTLRLSPFLVSFLLVIDVSFARIGFN